MTRMTHLVDTRHILDMTQPHPAIPPAPRRDQLLDAALLYVFSYDVEAQLDRAHLGFVPGGVRINIEAVPNRSCAYHVLRERTIGGLGVGAISGKLSSGGDRIFMREDDVEMSEVHMTIHTDDGAEIDVEYESVSWLGPDGFRRFVSGRGKYGSDLRPSEWPLTTAPRFRTQSPTYAWLMNYQGVGFGRVQLVNSEVRRITYDVYVLT
jgi:hypothetical protein